MATKTQTSAHTITLGYGYNTAGQLVTLTTPSGQQIGYTYSNDRIVGITINGPALTAGHHRPLRTAVHLAVGQWPLDVPPLRHGWPTHFLGVCQRHHDPAQQRSFDLASRVIGITDPDNPAGARASSTMCSIA